MPSNTRVLEHSVIQTVVHNVVQNMRDKTLRFITLQIAIELRV